MLVGNLLLTQIVPDGNRASHATLVTTMPQLALIPGDREAACSCLSGPLSEAEPDAFAVARLMAFMTYTAPQRSANVALRL